MSSHFPNAPEPPWQRFPDRPPWWGGWRQGEAESWYVGTFLRFWIALSPQHRAQYLARWQAPDADWTEYLARYAEQSPPPAPSFTTAPTPRWQQYPGRGPHWIGWQFGEPKQWLCDRFLPFWLALSAAHQEAYLRHAPPPDDRWLKRMIKWVERAA